MSDPVDPPIQPKRGGPDFHRDGCGCNACVARRRKAQALADGFGQASAAVEALSPPTTTDNEVIVTDAPSIGRNILKHRIKLWLKWKAIEPELSHKEAAKRFGIAPQTLSNNIYTATKEGWLRFEDPLNELRYEILPKVTHNLKYYLDQGDKEVTIKTAQGTIFRQFLDSEGIKDAPTTVLALKIEMPANPPSNGAGMRGQIVGSPRTMEPAIEAEIIKPKSE